VTEVFAAGGVEVREGDSLGRLRSACDMRSVAGVDLCVSGRRDLSGPRPAVRPTARLITASKNTRAATWSPDNSRTYERGGEYSIGFADDSFLPVRPCVPKPAAEESQSAPSGRSSTKSGRLASRISCVTGSDGRDADRSISSGAKRWSCSGTTIHIGSSGTLSRGAGRMLWTGADVGSSNSGAGFSDAIQSAI